MHDEELKGRGVMTPADQLGRLPEDMQALLWALMRDLADLTQDERHDALAGLNSTAEAFLLLPTPTRLLLMRLFAPLGDLIAATYHAAEPQTGAH